MERTATGPSASRSAPQTMDPAKTWILPATREYTARTLQSRSVVCTEEAVRSNTGRVSSTSETRQHHMETMRQTIAGGRRGGLQRPNGNGHMDHWGSSFHTCPAGHVATGHHHTEDGTYSALTRSSARIQDAADPASNGDTIRYVGWRGPQTELANAGRIGPSWSGGTSHSKVCPKGYALTAVRS